MGSRGHWVSGSVRSIIFPAMTRTSVSIPTAPPPAASVLARLRVFADDIKLHHTVFALPFALLSAFLAAGGWPRGGQIALVLVCMVTARTFAMALNRVLDAKFDAVNPRTARRAIPSGRVSWQFFSAIAAFCAAGFVLAASGFDLAYSNPWPIVLAIPVLGFVAAYPLLKRFTRYCHYYLGICLALAPLCAWVAIAGKLAMPPVWMAAAVVCWTAGFDIIYACQDYQADVAGGLHSIPARVGIPMALWISRATHLVCIGMLLALAYSTPRLGGLFLIGVGVAGVLLLVEHVLVKPNDLSMVNLSFFMINGVISLVLGTLGIINVLMT
jgi:4-hydroxybenzoate polyprenyltransferase